MQQLELPRVPQVKFTCSYASLEIQACMKAVSSWEIQILQATVTGTDLTLAAWGLCLQGSR